MTSSGSEPRLPANEIRECSTCHTPPAASVQVGGEATLFWFECRTCGKKTSVRVTFDAGRQEWNGMQEPVQSPFTRSTPAGR